MTDSAQAENRIRLMSSVYKYQGLLSKAMWPALIVACILSVRLIIACSALDNYQTPETTPDSTLQRSPAPAVIQPEQWKALRTVHAALPTSNGAIAGKLRLAGTYFAYGTTTHDSRKAILDNLVTGTQSIVNEGDRIGEIEILKIFPSRITLRASGQVFQLWLSFSRPEPSQEDSHQGDGQQAEVSGADTDKFGGKQVGERRWVYSRDSLLDYYDQLRDEPQRLYNVFKSLKPDYDTNRQIQGYYLEVEGEPEFFKSIGLREGDVIRTVNSMKMSNRQRAEYFIKEFVADRANVFLIDVERDGKTIQNRYEVR